MTSRSTYRLGSIGAGMIGLLCLTVPGQSRQSLDVPGTTDLTATLERYAEWTQVTRTPYRVAPAVNVLCAAANATPPSPHADAFIDVFVNQAGRSAMLGPRAAAFPVGSIIVKEKRAAADSADATLLTVMIKRPSGFNPDVGDWEFAVLDGTGTHVQEQGKLRNCAECHKTMSASDFVFRSYLDPST